MPYNLKKTAEKPYTKMLHDNVKDYDLDNDGAKNYDKMLDEERSGNKDTTKDGSLVTEKQLDDTRKEASDYALLEKKLNDGNTKLNEFSSSFRNDKGAHPMDYSKDGEKAEKKAYNAAEDKKRSKRKMDEIAGEQMIGEKTTIVGNEYKSQLLSNYETREDFEKKNRAIKKASKDLFDADGYLFAIYKTASDEGRGLISKEQEAVDNITESKIKIIANLEGWHEDFGDETYPPELAAEPYEQELELNQLSAEDDEGFIGDPEDIEGPEGFGGYQPDTLEGDEEIGGADLGAFLDGGSEPVNISQLVEQTKNQINTAESGDFQAIMDNFMEKAIDQFGMNWRQAEDILREEVLSD